MQAAEQLLQRVEHEANLRVSEVVVRLLSRYDEDIDDGSCREHDQLRAIYAQAAIDHHHAKKRWDGGVGGRQWVRFVDTEEALLIARKSYRDSVFHCGCSNKYDNRIPYANKERKRR